MRARPTHPAALNLLAPVRPDRAADLRLALDRLPRGDTSPLGRVPGTHFARWVIVPHLDRGFGRHPHRNVLREELLLFTAAVDGDPRAWLEALRAALPEEADAVWSHCAGYPGAADGRAFHAWAVRHDVPNGYSICPYRGATVADIRAALELRERVTRLAIEAQDQSPREVAGALRAAFPELG